MKDLINPEASRKEGVFSETLEGLTTKGWLLINQALDSYKTHRIIADVVRRQQSIAIADAELLIRRVAEKLTIDQTRDNPVDKFPWIPYGRSLLGIFPNTSDAGTSKLQSEAT